MSIGLRVLGFWVECFKVQGTGLTTLIATAAASPDGRCNTASRWDVAATAIPFRV